jgi:hypothetical protein
MAAPPRHAPHLPLPAVPFLPGPGRRRPHLPLERALEADGALGHGFSPTLFAYGADAFNCGCFWEAHECWELLWRREPRGAPRRPVLQGLILLAAARVKLGQGRAEGAAALHRKALALLAAARRNADLVAGFDLATLLAQTSGDVTQPPPVMGCGRSPR